MPSITRSNVRLLTLSLIAAFVLGACGSGEQSLGDVGVSNAKTPKVTVDAGFTTDETETRVIKKGAGATVKAGDTVKFNYLAVNGRTGKDFDSSYSTGKTTTITLKKGQILPGFIKALEGQKVGSRILAAVPPKDGFDGAQEQLDIKADDTVLFVFDVIAIVPTEAKGKAQKASADFPTLQLKDGKPSKFTSSSSVKAPTKPRAEVLIKGDGPKVEAGQSVSVQYLGQVFPNGKVFDSSWARDAPASFDLVEGGLISCWTDLLAGQTVGSRVVLFCPSDSAYGDKGREPDIKGGDTLVFSIDLLDAS